jgi:hypothetical protein
MEERQSFEVELPSRGVLYEEGTPLAQGVLHIYPIRVKEEKLFSGTAGSMRAAEAFNLMLSKCVAEKIDLEELLLVDRFSLMVSIRNLSYGPDYKFNIACRREKCGTRFDHTIDLSSLPVKYLDERYLEPYEVTLPVSGKTVGLRHFRARDETLIIDAGKRTKARKKKTEGRSMEDESYAERLILRIQTINGDEAERPVKIQFVENLIGRDASFIWKAVEDMDFGLDTQLLIECSECGDEALYAMPWQSDFLPWGEGRG